MRRLPEKLVANTPPIEAWPVWVAERRAEIDRLEGELLAVLGEDVARSRRAGCRPAPTITSSVGS